MAGTGRTEDCPPLGAAARPSRRIISGDEGDNDMTVTMTGSYDNPAVITMLMSSATA